MAPDAKLEIEATLRDKASKAVQGLRGKLGGLSSMMGKVVRAGALAAGVAVLALGVAAFKVGGDFEAAYNKIRVGTGATGDALEALKDDFKATLATVPQDFDAVATATADLNTRLGLTGPPLQAMAKQFLDLSRITEEEVGPAIAAGTRVFGDWAVATEDQEGALDRLFKVSQTTGIGVTDLATKVVNFGAPLRQMGFDLEDATTLLGKWEKEGVNTEAILGAMKIGVANFAKEGVDAATGLQDFVAELTEMGAGAEATTRAIEVFGSRAGPDMAAAVLEGRFSIDALSQTINASGETIAKAGQDALSMGDKFQILKNKVLVKLEPVIVSVFDKLEKGLDAVMPEVEAFADVVLNLGAVFKSVFTGDLEAGFTAYSKLPDSIKPVTDALIQLTEVIRDDFAPTFKTGLDTIMPLVEGLFNFVINNKPVMLVAIAAIGAAIVLAFGPVSVAIAALVAIIWVVGKVRENWDELSAKFEEIVGEIDEHLGFLRDIFEGVWQDISNQVMLHVNLIRGIVEIAMALLRGDWSAAWAAVKETASKVWDNIQGIVDGKLKVLSGLFQFFMAAVKFLWNNWWSKLLDAIGISDFWNKGVEIVEALWGGIASLKDWLFGKVGDMAGGMADKLNPKGWFGSPKGLENWLPFYMSRGIDKARATMTAGGPILAAGATKMMAGVSAAVQGSLVNLGTQVRETVQAALPSASPETVGVPRGPTAAEAIRDALAGIQGVGGGNRDALGAFRRRAGPYWMRLQGIFGRGTDFAPMLDQFIGRLRGRGHRLLETWRVVPSLATGGDVLRTGAAIVHAGERVGAPVSLHFAPGAIVLGGSANRRDAEALVDMVESAIRDRRLRGV